MGGGIVRLWIYSFLVIFCTILTSCTTKPTVELIQASAEIVTDKSISGQTGIMDGNKVLKYVTPTVLSYKFTVKNTSNQKIGDSHNPVKFKLEPSEEFISVLNQTIGSNVMDLTKMNGGYKADGEIYPNGTGQYTIFYELGTKEHIRSYQQIPLLPAPEKLELLNNKRFDVTLIISVGEEEIARFDLRTFANGLPQETEQRMEQELGTEIVVPVLDQYQVKFAEIVYSPVGDRRVARIVYTDQKGPLMELTQEQKDQIEKKQQRKFFYGEYEGKPLIMMEISNMKGSLANAKVQQIEGIDVEYSFKEVESGKYAFYSFNVENGSYLITFQLNKMFTEEDAVDFIRRILTRQK
jgi:hypothetical protein